MVGVPAGVDLLGWQPDVGVVGRLRFIRLRFIRLGFIRLGRWAGGRPIPAEDGIGVGEQTDPPDQGTGEFLRAQGRDVVLAGGQQLVGGGQDLPWSPAAVGGGGDGGDQGRPGGVGDDPGGGERAEQVDQGGRPGRPQPVRGRPGEGGGQLVGQPPPQGGCRLLVRQWPGAGDRVGQGGHVDAGAGGRRHPGGQGGPERVGQDPRFDLLGQRLPPGGGGVRCAQDGGQTGGQSLVVSGADGGWLGWSGGPRVRGWHADAGAPDGQVGSQLRVAVDQGGGPGRRAGGCPLARRDGQVDGQVGHQVGTGGQVVAPGRVVGERGGDARQPGQRPDWAGAQAGGVQAPVQDSGRVEGTVEFPLADRLLEHHARVVAGDGVQGQVRAQGGPGRFVGQSGPSGVAGPVQVGDPVGA